MQQSRLGYCLCLALAACGSKNSGGSGPDASNATDANSNECPATPCDNATQICSANGTCIPTGTCAVDQDCKAGMKCNQMTNKCEIGGCGGQLLDLDYVAPNLLLVLDRSCSMRDILENSTSTKWAAAVEAINTLSTTYNDDIRWGLTAFPDTTDVACAQDGPIPFPVAENNAAMIRTALTASLVNTGALFPDGPCVTNIDTGMEKAATDPGLADPTRDSYIMLISDGAQSRCNLAGSDNGTEMIISTLKNMRNIPTFVVGFGSGVDTTALNSFATAGGTARPAGPKYYQADTAAQLAEAFDQIANLVVSCQYTLSPAPANIDLTYVYYNNTESVPRDTSHAAGWDYDPATMQLTLYGSYCDRLKDRSVTDVDVVYGCDMPPIE